jgi:hypothetical protein
MLVRANVNALPWRVFFSLVHSKFKVPFFCYLPFETYDLGFDHQRSKVMIGDESHIWLPGNI